MAFTPQPALLQRQFEATLVYAVFGQLTHVNSTKLVDLCGNGIFFDQRFLGEGKLERVVSGERDIQALAEVISARVLIIAQKQCVVAQG